ncbi:hypothetical protein [Undibacterium rugosum]|uniref:Uncharacterized protein n=1 Tax=Undibacterium rugosum TaxID=2762291 RepID=A0A923KT89_9BURK|nr:hypothetical protein [Undibacterium rugosum]MBC3935779.1 hypothetical protein [Undibacterium rugosum]MBR7778459.1 hypothetical protein [Undibacterium rugosum]
MHTPSPSSSTTKLRRFIRNGLLAALLSSGAVAYAADPCLSCGSAKGSEAISLGMGVVVLGSASALAGSGQLVVTAVEGSANGISVVLKASGQASTTVIELSGKALEKTSLVAGSVLELSAVSTGYLLIASGKAIAFIPNEAGKALLHHQRA